MSVDLEFKLTKTIVDFKTAIAATKATDQTEAVFICNKEKIRIYSMEKDRISIVNTILEKDTFDTYEYNYDEKELKFQIVLEDFEKILNRIKNNDEIIITIPSNMGTVKVKAGKSNKEFTLKLLEIDQSLEQSMPTVEYTASLVTDVKNVINAIGDMETLSCEYVDINITEKNSSFSGDAEIGNSKSSIDGETEGSASSMYLIQPIKKFITGKTGEIKCELGVNKPLHINIPLTSGTIDLLLAPKVRN